MWCPERHHARPLLYLSSIPRASTSRGSARRQSVRPQSANQARTASHAAQNHPVTGGAASPRRGQYCHSRRMLPLAPRSGEATIPRTVYKRIRTAKTGRYSPRRLSHNISNTWLLTKRSLARNPFGEPDRSDFELYGLLVNDAVPFTGRNGPYCRGAASLRLVPNRLLTCSAGSPPPFQGEPLRVSAGLCTFG
jgi:hypothetical protein